MRAADELFECLKRMLFLPESGLLVAGFALAFQFLDAPQVRLEFLMDIARYRNHILKNLFLVKELRKVSLEPLIEFLEPGKELFPEASRGGFSLLGVLLVHLRIRRLDFSEQPPEVFEVAFAASRPCCPPRCGRNALGGSERSFRQSSSALGGEAQAINQALHFQFGLFDALADLDLLLAREQR